MCPRKNPYPEVQRNKTRKRLWMAVCGLLTVFGLSLSAVCTLGDDRPSKGGDPVAECTTILRKNFYAAMEDPGYKPRGVPAPCEELSDAQVNAIVEKLVTEVLTVEIESV